MSGGGCRLDGCVLFGLCGLYSALLLLLESFYPTTAMSVRLDTSLSSLNLAMLLLSSSSDYRS